MTAIVFALGPGGARLDPDSPRAAPTTGFEWWHVDANDPDAAESLDALELPPFAVDAMLAQTTRPFARIEADAVLTILRGVNLNDGADPEDMISIRVHAKANRVVTCTLRRLRALEDCRAGMEAGRVNGPGALLALLARRLGERMEGTLSALLETVTDLEEQILDDPRPDERRDIIAARRRVIMLRRYLAPQRDALSAMAGAEVGWFSRQDRDSLRLSIDRLARFVEDLEALRDRAQVVDDELGAALSERLNRNLYVLSVISAIFLPLGFITGLLGINVGGIPGAESGIAFWLVAGGLAFLGLGGVALFRLLRWL